MGTPGSPLAMLLNDYSLVSMHIILTGLVSMKKIQKNFCFKVRPMGIISTKTKK
mgnify:CR=1 FL=1